MTGYSTGVNPEGKRRPKRRHHGEGSRPFLAVDARRQRPWRCALRLGRDPETGKLRTKWFSGRHSAATIMLALGVQERVVQDILGHASGEQTRQYQHVVRRLGESAADKMSEAMS